MKAMIYKTLSTVVDDFFAYVAQLIGCPSEKPYLLTHVGCSFCIKMPILHRLACFRDDVVFLIFLYQASWSLCARFPELIVGAGVTALDIPN